MALSWSTGARDLVGNFCDYKRMLQGGKMLIFGSTVPASADAAQSSTLLCTVTLAEGAHTPEVCAAGSVTLAGNTGSVTSITVDGFEILGSTCTYVDSPSNLATLVAATINAYVPPDGPRYRATTSAAKVIITAMPGTGTTPNTNVVSTTVTGSVTKTDVAIGTEVAGVASVNGLTYGAISGGILAKGSGSWSGLNSAGGTATHFRILGSIADNGLASTTLVRVQGTCGYGTGDFPLSSTTLVNGEPFPVVSFSLVIPVN
jgi:hypothetical protein